MGTAVASDAYMQIAKDGVQKGGNHKHIQCWVDAYAADADAVVFAVDSNHELENALRVNAIKEMGLFCRSCRQKTAASGFVWVIRGERICSS